MLDHGALVLANVPLPRAFPRPVECDEIQAPEWGEIEKGEVEAPRLSAGAGARSCQSHTVVVAPPGEMAPRPCWVLKLPT